MKTTIDRAGRIVVPKPIRDRLGLRPGSVLELQVRDGRLEIEPEVLDVRLVRKGALTVAVPVGEVAPLAAEDVERTRQELERERGV